MIVGPSKAKGPAVNLTDLVKIKTLGTGTFGRVKLVQHKRTKQVFYPYPFAVHSSRQVVVIYIGSYLEFLAL